MRAKGEVLEVLNWISHSLIPKIISIYMWKAHYRYLPFGDKIKKICIPTIPTCNCYEQRIEEKLDHVLSTGTFACSIWRRATTILGMFNVGLEPFKVKFLDGLKVKRPLTSFLVGILPMVIA